MSNKKTSANVALIIQSILVLALLVMTLFSLKEETLLSVINLVILVFAALYGSFLYKKPHGNMLKYAMLLFSGSIVVSSSLYLCIVPEMTSGIKALEVTHLIAAFVITYGAGRLDRIGANKYLFSLALLMFAVPSFMVAKNFMAADNPIIYLLKAFYNTILFLTLCCAYFTRYKEHKEAGLADAPNGK